MILYTGTGRCGTGYVARVLSASGRPCGHEYLYNPYRVPHPDDHLSVVAESSWCALAYSEALESAERVYHVVRDPADVFRSFMSIGFFAREHLEIHGPYVALACRAFPALAREIRRGRADDATRMWIEWVYDTLEYCERVHVDRAVSFEAHLARSGQTPKGLAEYRGYNSRSRTYLGEIPDAISAIRKELGYVDEAT